MRRRDLADAPVPAEELLLCCSSEAEPARETSALLPTAAPAADDEEAGDDIALVAPPGAGGALNLSAARVLLYVQLGLIAAYLGSLAGWAWKIEELMYFDFVAIFAFLMLGGRWLQQAALEQRKKDLAVRKVARDAKVKELSDAGKQNAYRFTPWSSVYGEGSTDPLS